MGLRKKGGVSEQVKQYLVEVKVSVIEAKVLLQTQINQPSIALPAVGVKTLLGIPFTPE